MRVVTELVRQATQLQETEQAIRRLDQLMNQADQRAKDAEDKASAAVTAIGVVKTPEQGKIKHNNRDAEKFRPETYTADCVDKNRDVPECSGTRLIGETVAGMCCHLPRPGDRDE